LLFPINVLRVPARIRRIDIAISGCRKSWSCFCRIASAKVVFKLAECQDRSMAYESGCLVSAFFGHPLAA